MGLRTVPTEADIRSIQIDLPAPPAAMMRISSLMADPLCPMSELGAVIESDMALAAAVLKAVNSSMFGLAGSVQSVQHALIYLGVRDVAAVTLQAGLRAMFPAAPELEALWTRAALRGRSMSRLALTLGMDPWVAHSAGLFEECGKAVLFRHEAARYAEMMASSKDDAQLLLKEQDHYGVGHDALGAALCESWGLAPSAVSSVRHHVELQTSLLLPMPVDLRALCALSALTYRLETQPQALPKASALMAEQLHWDAPELLAALQTEQALLKAMSGG